jgi:flagellar biosynthesis/type III secretory pathway protein FliH
VIKAGTTGFSSSSVTNENDVSSSVKSAIIESAILMAKRIVEAEIDRNPALLERIFVRSLLVARSLTTAEVRVHPLDRAAFDIDALAHERGFLVESDDEVGRGGCRIVASAGEVDASIETLFDAFRASLKGVI